MIILSNATDGIVDSLDHPTDFRIARLYPDFGNPA